MIFMAIEDFESECVDYVMMITKGDPCLEPGAEREIVRASAFCVPKGSGQCCPDDSFWNYYDVNGAISQVATRKLTIASHLVTSTAAPGSAPGDQIARRWARMEAAYSGTHAA